MNQTKSRYPGVRPFDIYDSNRFFGRDEELARLCENIEFEKLLILHGKSGYGKSSIIKAGVIPNFSNKGKSNSFKTIYLSLKEKNDDPVNLISNHPSLKAIPIDNNFSEIEKIGLTQNLLWWEFKKRQNSADKYCLFLDQFEDFFSIDYSDQKRKDFARSLADLLYIDNPPELRKKWKDLPQNIKGYTIKPLEIKIIIIIRSDKISELDFFKPILGDKINRRFELGPLKRDQAIKAIVKPARLQDPSFNSPPFEYAESGINKIMEELTKSSNSRKINNEEIEAFQLQIICEHIENKVRNEEIRDIDGNGLPDITESEIPDMKDLYENYYKIKLDLIPDNLRKDAQILIEEKLVAEDAESGIGIRKSVDKLDLNKYGEGLLDTLEDAYLIRREKNTLGGYNYELCHDTLIAPVLKVKKERQLEEIKKREKAERLKSEEELRIANERAKQAEKQAQETDRLRRIAEDAKKQAETSLKKAEKLTDAFYFYKDKYAVAFKENKFYFIDKDGEEYTELGRWDKAEQFDEDIGFAKVTIDKQKAGLALGADNFLDTSENNETTSKQTVDGDLALNQSTVSIIDQNAGLFIGANDSSNTPENRELASKPSVDGYSTLSQSIINSKRQREKQTIEYLINEEGNRYQVCYELHDLNEDIKAIDLRGKQFDTFPTEIFRFPQLQVLIISGKDGRENNFETIPDEIDKLVDLVHIFMDFCKIKKFPKVYGPTKKLLCLSLMNNLIEEVPDDFYCTSNLLKFLNLNNNALSTISGYVSKLDNLEILGLGGNSLNEVSDELWKLKNLKTLALWQTNLQHIPSNIGNLSVLENLYLHNNNIENIPEELYCLTNLVELDLSLNKISTISSSVGKLSKLQILYLYDNQNLSELPEAIYDLEELLELNLTRTNLTFISEAICKLKNLKSLALGGNQITSIPKKLWNLEKIKEL
jgi:Leucine-rich repeat (LRR) protein